MFSLKKFIRAWLGISDNALELEPQRKNVTAEPVNKNKVEVTDEFYLNDDSYGRCHLYRWRRMSNNRTDTLQLEYIKGQPTVGHWDHNCPKVRHSKSMKFYSN